MDYSCKQNKDGSFSIEVEGMWFGNQFQAKYHRDKAYLKARNQEELNQIKEQVEKMTIETKFNIGDEVWIPRQGKNIKTKILHKHHTVEEWWVLEEIDKSLMLGFDVNMMSPESKLFKTKEELIQSL